MWWLTTEESVRASTDNNQCEIIIVLVWTRFKYFPMFRKLDDGDDKFIQCKLKWKSHDLIVSEEGSTEHSLTVLFWRDF